MSNLVETRKTIERIKDELLAELAKLREQSKLATEKLEVVKKILERRESNKK